MNRKKKSICYLLTFGALIYFIIQVVYFNQEYRPLQVLSDARSEARRLHKFITSYHYLCNNTVLMSNSTNWPICTEIEAGINMESKKPKKAYSVGPSEDLEFERLLVKNLSFSVFILSHDLKSYIHEGLKNKTYYIRTVIVPNDPSDFTRNSFESQTLNDLMLNLHHDHIDILKIESVTEMAHSHEILYFLVKDNLLKKVDQLHITLHIDKVDDDYLYSWYRSLYNLFHNSRFRLYHTSASDQLCLQITLMESCTYYMSWVKDPGPQAIIYHPPAIDGSKEFEIARLQYYLERPDGNCDKDLEIPLQRNVPLSLCVYTSRYKLSQPCKIIVIGPNTMVLEGAYLNKNDQCDFVGLKMKNNNLKSNFIEYTVNKRGSVVQSTPSSYSLMEALDKYTLYDNKNIIYLNMPVLFWNILTPLLDSGVLKGIHQLIIDVNFQNINKHDSGEIRMHYSELLRIQSYGFDLYKSTQLFQYNNLYRLNYIKTRSWYSRK